MRHWAPWRTKPLVSASLGQFSEPGRPLISIEARFEVGKNARDGIISVVSQRMNRPDNVLLARS